MTRRCREVTRRWDGTGSLALQFQVCSVDPPPLVFIIIIIMNIIIMNNVTITIIVINMSPADVGMLHGQASLQRGSSDTGARAR